MNWVSIDLGKNTGIAKWLLGKLTESKSVELQGNNFDERLWDFHRRIHRLLFPREGERPELIVVEIPAGHPKNWKSISQLWQMLGTLKGLCAQTGVKVVELVQTEIKKLVTGKGNAIKEEVAEAVKAACGEICFVDYDESDAIAVGLAYLSICEEAETV